MVKILTYIVGIMAMGMAILYFCYNRAENKINALETQKNELTRKTKELENAIQEYNDAEERAKTTIEKVKTVVKTINEPCDCYNTAIDRELLGIIRGTN